MKMSCYKSTKMLLQECKNDPSKRISPHFSRGSYILWDLLVACFSNPMLYLPNALATQCFITPMLYQPNALAFQTRSFNRDSTIRCLGLHFSDRTVRLREIFGKKIKPGCLIETVR